VSISASLGKRKTVELPAGTAVYREAGRGEPVVLLHALMVNGDEWRSVIPTLSKSMRCITPELPFGSHEVPMSRSADLGMPALADWLDRFLQAIGVERATFVGNDAGGVLTQLMLARHPERVERAVLACCDSYEDFPPKDFEILKPLARVPGALLLLGLALMSRGFRRSRMGHALFITNDPEPTIVRSYLRPLLRPAIRRDLAKVMRAVSTSITLSAAETFPRRKQPVLVAWASDDRVFAKENPERLAKAFPNGTFEVIPGSRVFIPEDAPDGLTDAILRFVARTPGRAAGQTDQQVAGSVA
jgi:pimeloyl-ACP methyl ester carboxylesterase